MRTRTLAPTLLTLLLWPACAWGQPTWFSGGDCVVWQLTAQDLWMFPSAEVAEAQHRFACEHCEWCDRNGVRGEWRREGGVAPRGQRPPLGLEAPGGRPPLLRRRGPQHDDRAAPGVPAQPHRLPKVLRRDHAPARARGTL